VLPQTEEDLILYLTFNEGAGGISHDYSINGNNGTLHNATWIEGKFHKGLQFSTDKYVVVKHNNTLDFGGYFTIEFWIKGYTEGVKIFEKEYTPEVGVSPGPKGWNIRYENNNIVFHATFGLDYIWHSHTIAYNVNDNKWHHVAVVVESTVITGYLDGSIDAQEVSSSEIRPNTGGNLKIGKINGILDEIKIYNRALTEDEIRAHYKGAAIKLRS